MVEFHPNLDLSVQSILSNKVEIVVFIEGGDGDGDGDFGRYVI
jgi:hypothetical protein